MPENPKERRNQLATNRLLELLRAQQAGSTTDSADAAAAPTTSSKEPETSVATPKAKDLSAALKEPSEAAPKKESIESSEIKAPPEKVYSRAADLLKALKLPDSDEPLVKTDAHEIGTQPEVVSPPDDKTPESHPEVAKAEESVTEKSKESEVSGGTEAETSPAVSTAEKVRKSDQKESAPSEASSRPTDKLKTLLRQADKERKTPPKLKVEEEGIDRKRLAELLQGVSLKPSSDSQLKTGKAAQGETNFAEEGPAGSHRLKELLSIETPTPEEKTQDALPEDDNLNATRLIQETPVVSEVELGPNEEPPTPFDSSLLSQVLDEESHADSIGTVFRRSLHEGNRRLTLVFDERCLRVLSVDFKKRKRVVTFFKEFCLPYQTDNKNITEIEELTRYILANQFKAGYRHKAFGALCNISFNSRTLVIRAPKLKAKDQEELVQWSGRKNLPFNPEHAILVWEDAGQVGLSDKRNLVISVLDGDESRNLARVLQHSGLKPRLFVTVPILLWKSFIHNYPERKKGGYLLVHIGENRTHTVVVIDQVMTMSREMPFGVEDARQALQQKIVTPEGTLTIDATMAEELLERYGIPRDKQGLSMGSRISLYKLSIFLRPFVERLTGEINRSIKFFKKDFGDLEVENLVLDGPGASIANLPQILGENLNLRTEILNPVRRLQVKYQNQKVIQDRELPRFSLNFALTLDEVEKHNLIPTRLNRGYKFIFWSKVAGLIFLLLLPLVGVDVWYMEKEATLLQKQVTAQTQLWTSLTGKTKRYFDMLNDIQILNSYQRLVENDRRLTSKELAVLKVLSNTTPENVKISGLTFVRDYSADSTQTAVKYPNKLKLNGFVSADPSVADIQLTNFIMSLEQTHVVTNIHLELDKTRDSNADKLFFSLAMEF